MAQKVKTLLAVGGKVLGRQRACIAKWLPVGEAEASAAGVQLAEE